MRAKQQNGIIAHNCLQREVHEPRIVLGNRQRVRKREEEQQARPEKSKDAE